MYGRSQEFIKELKSDILELEHYLKDTCEDLKRLKVRFKYLTKQKLPGQAGLKEDIHDKSPTTAKKRRASALTVEQLSQTNSHMISQDISISQISHLSNNSYFVTKQENESSEAPESSSSSESDSSRSLRSKIKAENFFQMRVNSFTTTSVGKKVDNNTSLNDYQFC